MTQEEFGQKFGRTGSNVSCWESGKHLPKRPLLHRIATAFGKPPSFMYGVQVTQETPAMVTINPHTETVSHLDLRLEYFKTEIENLYKGVNANGTSITHLHSVQNKLEDQHLAFERNTDSFWKRLKWVFWGTKKERSAYK